MKEYNLAGATTSILFFIDPNTDVLLRQEGIVNLTRTQIGSGLGVDITKTIGYDIALNGLALACVQIGNNLVLYLVDLSSGTFSQNLGQISQPIISVAIPTAYVAYAIVSSSNSLLYINTLESGLSFTSKNMSGLQNNETILAIDIRPQNGQLFALGSFSRLYGIDLGPGIVYEIGNGSTFTPLLDGTAFGMDFNPTVDRIRVVSNFGQNLRLNPDTGDVAGVDGEINPTAPNITAIAYTNNVANATSTVLYDIDSGTDRLYIQIPPNNGTLVDVGPLGIDISDNNGFDIGSRLGDALTLVTINGVTSVYKINLSTGAATNVPNTVFPVAAKSYTLGLNV